MKSEDDLRLTDLLVLSVSIDRSICVVRSAKSILLVGEFYFDFGEAQRAFVNDKCPISECTLTLDADRSRRTVDAVVILNMDAIRLCDYLPKPAHQVNISVSHRLPRSDIGLMRCR